MKPGRTSLTFNVIGMAARESMLLKSFVRMLDSRTRQRWVYKAQQDSHEQQAADLTFLGDEGEPVDANAATTGPRQLRMGVLALEVFSRLDRPLRPDELERELNRMGKLLVTARMQAANTLNLDVGSGASGDAQLSSSRDENAATGKPLYLWQLPQQGSTHSEFVPTNTLSREFAGTAPMSLPVPLAARAVVPVLTPAIARVQAAQPPVAAAVPVAVQPLVPAVVLKPVQPTDKLRLLRWPHANLISTPPKLKLAAFMASSSNTLESLQRTSGQPMAACVEFVQALNGLGFLSVKPYEAAVLDKRAEHAQTPAVAASTGSMRNGDPSKAPRAAAGSPGLFARIRARLGMPLTG